MRYNDNFVLIAAGKAELKSAGGLPGRFGADEVPLQLKVHGSVLAPVTHGLPFLGWRLYCGTRRMRPTNLRRIRLRVRR